MAISIMIGQIGRVTGLQIEANGFASPLIELIEKADQIHLPSLALAAAMFAILQAVRLWPVAIPGPVIVVIVAGILSAVF
ncbi:SulP family inorganic anion transporter, partial [Klebsiella pneumoniae]|uniref:SulP family inorganic anion transporter n=1 Tax=Klebsiella pneumoniae TaxID=573 RepID=UPI002731A954